MSRPCKESLLKYWTKNPVSPSSRSVGRNVDSEEFTEVDVNQLYDFPSNTPPQNTRLGKAEGERV